MSTRLAPLLVRGAFTHRVYVLLNYHTEQDSTVVVSDEQFDVDRDYRQLLALDIALRAEAVRRLMTIKPQLSVEEALELMVSDPVLPDLGGMVIPLRRPDEEDDDDPA